MEPLPPRRARTPRKVVSNPVRAQEVMAALRESELELRRIEQERLKLILEASDLGVTSTKIGEAVGLSQTAVSKWLRNARVEQLNGR